MKLRRLINLPVFDEHTAQIVGRVIKAVIGDDFRLSYLVIESPQGYGILRRQDLQLSNDAVCIKNIRSIKPYNNRKNYPYITAKSEIRCMITPAENWVLSVILSWRLMFIRYAGWNYRAAP